MNDKMSAIWQIAKFTFFASIFTAFAIGVACAMIALGWNLMMYLNDNTMLALGLALGIVALFGAVATYMFWPAAKKAKVKA